MIFPACLEPPVGVRRRLYHGVDLFYALDIAGESQQTNTPIPLQSICNSSESLSSIADNQFDFAAGHQSTENVASARAAMFERCGRLDRVS